MALYQVQRQAYCKVKCVAVARKKKLNHFCLSLILTNRVITATRGHSCTIFVVPSVPYLAPEYKRNNNNNKNNNIN